MHVTPIETPSDMFSSTVRISRAADLALDHLILDELAAEPVKARRASTAVMERLEGRTLMAGDASIVQSLPFSLDFSTAAQGGILDKNGLGTGFTYVQNNTPGNEYQANLINLDTTGGKLKLTTTGTSTAGGPWETDNSLVNSLQTGFNATTGGFTISARLTGPLGFLAAPSQQGGIVFGPDQDNYIKLVAVSSPTGQFLQFVDEQKPGTTFVHGIAAANSLTSVGSFANIQTLDLYIAGDPTTGTITGYYKINNGPLTQLTQSLTLTGTQKAKFFSASAKAGLFAMAKNDLPPVTVTYDSFGITNGVPVQSRPSVNGSNTTPGNGSTDVWRDAYVSAAVTLPNLGGGVDTATLSSTTVLLYRTSDRALVSGHASTSGAGDTITFQPDLPLDANTSYTFEVTAGVRDTTGAQFLPYKMTFTTGSKITETDPNIAFEKVALNQATGQEYTCLTVGPDGKLYATTFDGLIQRFTINADGTLGAPQNITTIRTANGANRTITSIVFDPSSTAQNLIAWVSHGQYAPENATDFTGKVSKLTGVNLETCQDAVTNLPRSVRDHLNNQLVFGPDGAIYFCNASNSAMGAPDNAWGMRPERLLTAAILRLDTAAINQRLASGQGALNVQTENNPNGNYNPFAQGAPLTIYASGVRNAYDLVWTRAGFLYAPTNGSAAGANTPSFNGTFSGTRIDGRTITTPVQGITNVQQTENDYLFRIDQGGYYGHPNPLRGEYVQDGGNPTSGVDYEEFTQYPTGTQPDPNYRGAAYVFGRNHSPDGAIEYKGSAFNGALDGKLLVTRYSGGADVMLLTPDAQGNITKAEAGIAGLTGFINPLDITQDTRTGFLYIADFGAGKIFLARPIAPGANISAPKSTYYYNDDYASSNTTASPTQNIRIYNTGTAPLSIPPAGLALSDTNYWSIVTRPDLPTTIPAGGYVDIGVAFKALSTGGAGIKTATLTITSNDADTPNLVINLRGLATAGKGGQLEPSLQRVFQLFQLPITTGDINSSNTNLFSNTEPLSSTNDEVYVQRLIKASTGPVTIEPLAGFAGGSPASRIGYYEAGTTQARTQLFTVNAADAQSVNLSVTGATSFDPGSKTFGLYAEFPIFKFNAYSEDVLNTSENTVANRRKIRFYQLKNPDGSVVPNAYVFTCEDYINDTNGAYDTQDFVGIIRNVQVAPAGADLGIENLDNTSFPDRLVFNRIQQQPPDKRMDYNPATGLNDLEVQPPNNVVHDKATLRIRNTGTDVLTLNGVSVSNGWTIVNPPDVGTQVAPGAFYDLTVQFVAQNKFPGQTGNQTIDLTGRNAYGGSAWSGTLTISTNDVQEPVKTVQLAGWWQYKSEALMEPNAATMVNLLYGYKTSMLSTGQSFGSGTLLGQSGQAAGEEVISNYWVRADANYPVSVRQLAAYHSQGNTASIRAYAKHGIFTNLFSHNGDDGQSLLPRNNVAGDPPAYGTFTPLINSTTNPTGAFTLWVDGEYGDDTKNKPVTNQPQDTGHHMRFWPARDRDGNIIPNTWIMGMDYQGINYDYQDNMYLVTNMRPENPAAPTAPAAAAQGPGINVTWTAPTTPTVSGYNVYRSTSATGTFTKLNTSPVTDVSYLDTGTAAGVTYYYKVTATDSFGGESAQTAAVSGQRSADLVPPSTPTGLTAAAGATGIQLGWAANTDVDLAGYRIFRSTSAAGTYLGLNSGAITSATATGFLDTTAQTGVTYYYKISAVDLSANESSLSDAASATLVDSTPPAVPANVAASGSTSAIGVTWRANTDADLAGYRVYRSNAASGTFSVISGSSLLTSTSYSDASVAAGETWYYYITAVDAAGNESAGSSTVNATRLAQGAVVVRINAGGTAFTDGTGNGWAADNSFVGGTASTGAYDVLGTSDDALFYTRRYGNMTYNIAVPNGTYTLNLYFADPSMTAAGKRVFDVKANGTTILSSFDVFANAGGKTLLKKTFTVNVTNGVAQVQFINKIDNAIVSAIELIGASGGPVDTTPPASPSGFAAATRTGGGINLNWTANGESDLAGYNLYRSTSPTGTFTKVNSSVLTGTSYTDTTAPGGVTSYYQLVAVDTSGNASGPAVASATAISVDTTPPAAPSGVMSQGKTTGNSLWWNPNTEPDLAGYIVYRASSLNGTYYKMNSTLLTTPKYFDTTASVARTVYYKIVAVDTSGNASTATVISAYRPSA